MPFADVIIANAKVFTSDESNPGAEAVAVIGNRIIYVGRSEGARAVKDKSTRVIDGQGQTLAPGITHSHVHLLSGAIWMGKAQLDEVRTADYFARSTSASSPLTRMVTVNVSETLLKNINICEELSSS